jgi:hypothetical protein
MPRARLVEEQLALAVKSNAKKQVGLHARFRQQPRANLLCMPQKTTVFTFVFYAQEEWRGGMVLTHVRVSAKRQTRDWLSKPLVL